MRRGTPNCGCSPYDRIFDEFAGVKARLDNVETNKQDAILLGTAGQVLATDSSGTALEWIDQVSPAVEVVDALDSTETDKALSANQGRVLDGKIGDNFDYISAVADDVSAIDTEIHTTHPYVTTDTNQTISGGKTHSANQTMKGCNLIFSSETYDDTQSSPGTFDGNIVFKDKNGTEVIKTSLQNNAFKIINDSTLSGYTPSPGITIKPVSGGRGAIQFKADEIERTTDVSDSSNNREIPTVKFVKDKRDEAIADAANKYVDLTTAQSINGVKTFTKAIQGIAKYNVGIIDSANNSTWTDVFKVSGVSVGVLVEVVGSSNNTRSLHSKIMIVRNNQTGSSTDVYAYAITHNAVGLTFPLSNYKITIDTDNQLHFLARSGVYVNPKVYAEIYDYGTLQGNSRITTISSYGQAEPVEGATWVKVFNIVEGRTVTTDSAQQIRSNKRFGGTYGIPFITLNSSDPNADVTTGAENTSVGRIAAEDVNGVQLWEIGTTIKTDGHVALAVRIRKSDGSMKTVTLAEGN